MDNSKNEKSINENLSLSRINYLENFYPNYFTNHEEEEDEFSFNLNIPPIPKLEKQNIHYRCSKCLNFPVINFFEKNEEIISYSCYCFDNKIIKIEDLFKKDKENTYMTFFDDNNLLSNNSQKNEIKGFKCTKHKTLENYNNFEYYSINEEKKREKIFAKIVSQNI